MIKIAHIANPVAGVGLYVSLLARHLNNKKFKNIIIGDLNEGAIEVKDSLDENTPLYHIKLDREIKLINDIKGLFRIIKLLKELKPDIIHCHSAKAGILGRMAGAYLKTPTLYTPHAYSYLSTKSIVKKKVFKSIEKLFRFLPSKTLACSTSEYNRTISDLKVNKKKVYLWNNSIEDGINLETEKAFNHLPEKFICSIGRPSYQKHTELLVKMIIEVKKTTPNIHLVILGIGFYSPSLEKINNLIKTNSLDKNITLIPWLNRTETMSILNKSQLYVSSSRYEGLPYSIIEALELSKPCVVTNVDGNKDLIQNSFNGFLVEQEANMMAQRVTELLENKELLEQLSMNARKSFEKNYNISKNIKSLERIYLSILN